MISVIIPVYNTEPYLEKCVRSVLSNTYRDLEVICVNDGSTDQSLSILQHLSEEDRRIRIIDQENQGISCARNAGLRETSGEYIAFIDSDDWVHPSYFQSLLECMDHKKADIAICGCFILQGGEDAYAEKASALPFRQLSGETFFKNYYARHMCWGRLYRRRVIEGLWFTPEILLGEDTLFNLRAVSQVKHPSVWQTETPLYCYFQRKSSMSRQRDHKELLRVPEWVALNYQGDEQNEWSWMLPMHALKTSLSCRYSARLEKDRKGEKYSNQLAEALLKRVLKDSRIPAKEKGIHLIMKASPQVYRRFRIKDDPTMRKWERIVHERQRKGK